MNRFSLPLIITVFLFHCSNAQNPLIKLWDHRYGGTGNEKLSVFRETKDRGFVLGGVSSSAISGDKSQPSWDNTLDYWIVKIDAQGTKEWDKRFGGTRKDELTAIQQTSDGGYIIASASASDSSFDKTDFCRGGIDFWIIKIDSSGNVLKQNTIGGDTVDSPVSIHPTPDGGLLVFGTSRSNVSFEKRDSKSNDLSVYEKDVIKHGGELLGSPVLITKKGDVNLYMIQNKDGIQEIRFDQEFGSAPDCCKNTIQVAAGDPMDDARCLDYNGYKADGVNRPKSDPLSFVNFVGSDCSIAVVNFNCGLDHYNGGCFQNHEGVICSTLIGHQSTYHTH